MLAQLVLDFTQMFEPFGLRWWQETTCSVLVGIACGVLGCFVVLRRMALIGDALAHAVLPGVVIAFILTQSTSVVGLLLGALIAGVATAGLIGLVSRISRTKEDSAIGIVFTAFFALGIILISNLPRGTHFDLKCFLFGDPLAVGTADLWMMAIIAPLVLLVVAVLFHPMRLASFDPIVAAAMGVPVVMLHYLLMGMLSATVVAGLKTTGVVLVVAMIITPASAAYQLTNRLSIMLLLSGIFGAISAAAGMSLAFVANAPTGPAMVLVAAFIFTLTMFFSPSHGLVFDWLRRRQTQRHHRLEDVLKAIFHLRERGEPTTLDAVARRARLTQNQASASLQSVEGLTLAQVRDGNITLSDAGDLRATELVRAHRLWESYLAEQANVQGEAIHTQAERLEHAHELADDVDQTLGHPSTDPHGEAIPKLPGKR